MASNSEMNLPGTSGINNNHQNNNNNYIKTEFRDSEGDPTKKILIHICQLCETELKSDNEVKKHCEQKHDEQFLDTNNENNKSATILYGPAKVDKNGIWEKMKGLNNEQRTFVMHVYKCIKNNENLPLRIFLNGSAGVGKSYVIDTLYQLITHHYDTLPGASPDTTKVLLTALTGKAASNIDGMTIHSAFGLRVQSSRDVISEKRKKDTRKVMQDLKLIIIDEISFVSSELLERINKKLNSLFKSDKTFGGFSIIFVGDLLQLPPIGRLVFLPPKKSTGRSYR